MAKKTDKEKVRCIDCIHAELMQWYNNPVIAKCPFTQYKQVANAVRTCGDFVQGRKKAIKKMTQ